MTDKTIELKPAAPSVSLTARLYDGSLLLTERGPRGGYYPITIPKSELPALAALIAGPIRVLVALEGGTVQGAVCDHAGCSVTVLDYDTDGAAADQVFAIPQDGDRGPSDAYRNGVSAVHDPAFIDAAEAAPLADPKGAIAELRERAEQWAKPCPELAAEALAEANEIEAQLTREEQAAA
jgi:hypothetical protein